MPDTIWYLIWDVVKSCMYMTSLYTLAYSAAFRFEGENSFEVFELVVDIVQIVDIIHTFFTAKKVRSLTQTTLKLRKKEMDALESKQGLHVQKAKEVEWEVNQKYISIDYLITFLVMDMAAIIPFIMGDAGSGVWLSLRFFRLFRIKRILLRLDDFAIRF